MAEYPATTAEKQTMAASQKKKEIIDFAAMQTLSNAVLSIDGGTVESLDGASWKDLKVIIFEGK